MEIEKIVKKLSHLHSTSTETPTDFLLARIIVNQLTVDWSDPTNKFLDPSCGRGTILLALAEKLEAAGHSRQHILKNMLYGYDIKRVQTLYTIKSLSMVEPGPLNIMLADFLTMEPNMKFNVIIGNPPYQAPKKGDYSFWARFVDKAHKFLTDDGHLSMIIPARWMSPTNDIRQGQRSVMRDIFAKEDTYYVNIDPNIGRNHFPGVGQKFTWFALRKGQYTTTKFDFGSTQINVDISDMPMLAKETDATNISIISKITKKIPKWGFTRYIMSESWDDVLFESNKTHKHPRINGNSNHLDKIVFTKTSCKYQAVRKVVLPYNGSDYKFVIETGGTGCTNAYVMLLEDTDLIESAKVYFESPVIRWLGKNKFTQYNEGALINSISKMDLSKKITLSDIYQFYKLTKEEIDYVEANTK